MKGIVITTSEATKVFLPELLESIKSSYPVLVVGNETSGEHIDITNNWNGFELGGIKRGYERFDEFVHLMDTCLIKDNEMFDIMFKHNGSMYLCDGFYSYLGKYRKEVLDQIGVPMIDNKDDAIHLERAWNKLYLQSDLNAEQFIQPLPIHTDNFIEKHGRKNMVLENDYIIKYKGTWSL